VTTLLLLAIAVGVFDVALSLRELAANDRAALAEREPPTVVVHLNGAADASDDDDVDEVTDFVRGEHRPS
jgi:hypothetical protein